MAQDGLTQLLPKLPESEPKFIRLMRELLPRETPLHKALTRGLLGEARAILQPMLGSLRAAPDEVVEAMLAEGDERDKLLDKYRRASALSRLIRMLIDSPQALPDPGDTYDWLLG